MKRLHLYYIGILVIGAFVLACQILLWGSVTGCTLQQRPDPLIPEPMDIRIAPCVVTVETDAGSVVTIDLGEVSGIVVQEASQRALGALQGAGVALPPILASLASGVAQGAVDEGLCRAFEALGDQVSGDGLKVTVERL